MYDGEIEMVTDKTVTYGSDRIFSLCGVGLEFPKILNQSFICYHPLSALFLNNAL
mgnify:CR=1 FL=1